MMLNICLSLVANSSNYSHSDNFEHQYQSIFKKLLSFLYSHPRYKMSFSFSGPMFSWLEKKHPEFLQILGELVAKKQIELLGGGYYNPIFPLIFPIDRSGQIELLTSTIRKSTGKRPRGMAFETSAWDNSLINCLHSCGMEFIMLDSSLIPTTKQFFLPQILNEQGKTIKLIPINRKFNPSILKEVSPEVYLNNLIKQIEKSTKNDAYSGKTNERILGLAFEPDLIEYLFNSGWLESFFNAIYTTFNKDLTLLLPTEFIHKTSIFVPSYIPAGIREDIARWSVKPYTIVDTKQEKSITVNDFLLTYPRNQALYNRMLYVSMLISQCHGDKARKKSAREALWQAQNEDAYICTPDGIFANNMIRQNAYRSLTEAEKYIRAADTFKESVTSYDYNNDGLIEYICRMDKYTACISKNAGAINELNIMHNTGNYADNLSRIEKFDKVDDNYDRGFFVEHLFSKDDFDDYKKGLPAGNGVFSQTIFTESEFSPQKKEIKLKGVGEFSSLKLPISLRKNYILNSNGFTVQYILKNEGPIAIKGNFVVESNFAQTDFTSVDTNSYKVEVISSDDRHELPLAKKTVSMKNISYIQVTDFSNDISFVFEPNEYASICCSTLYFKRPNISNETSKISANTFITSLCWDVDLSAGMEMEKTINFSIITPRKRRSSKKENS